MSLREYHRKLDSSARGSKAHVRGVPEAVSAGLRYVSDAAPGLSRIRSGKGFRYRHHDGRAVRDAATLSRIRSLAIPPAWTDVWICPSPEGHLQATGRDSRRRKQYRYHPHWRQVRDESKYERMVGFARALPQIRRRVAADLARPGLPREKVVATVVSLLEATLIRVGNEEYARQNGSFGLTTLRDSHVDVSGSKLAFRFKGKSGREHVVGVEDARLRRIVKQCRELPGYELFQYLDQAGRRRSVESADVNRYLRELAGEDYTAKDFRTWAGTVLAAWALLPLPPAGSKAGTGKNVARAVESVAARLGNTPAVCRKSYVHPGVIEAYVDGSLQETLDAGGKDGPRRAGLRREEACVLALLTRLRREAKPAAKTLRRPPKAA